MMSWQKQFWAIIRFCREQYSEDTIERVADLLVSHKNVIKIYSITQSNPTEQEFLKMLDKAFPTE